MREVINKQGRKSDVPFAESLKKVYARFLEIRGEPRDIALGFALGLFVGMTPTMGFQTPLAVFFAALFKLNKISAAMKYQEEIKKKIASRKEKMAQRRGNKRKRNQKKNKITADKGG